MARRYRKKVYRKKTYRRNRRTRYSRTRKIRKIVNRVLNQKSETKNKLIATENAQLYHNVDYPFLIDPWQNISKGTGGSERIGDRITNRGIKYKLWLSNKFDRPNITYRFVIGTIPQSVNGTQITQSNCVQFVWKQADQGSLANSCILTADKEFGTRIIYDKMWTNKIGYSEQSHRAVVGAGGCEHHIVKKFWLKPKRSAIVQYQDGQGGSRGRLLFQFVVAYDSYGTLLSDNIASFAWSIHLYWKDF